MYEFTLLRHGESQGNVEAKHQGQSEFPLTALGRRQAQALAERWGEEGRSFDHVFASPLQRASQTAELVNAVLKARPAFRLRHF